LIKKTVQNSTCKINSLYKSLIIKICIKNNTYIYIYIYIYIFFFFLIIIDYIYFIIINTIIYLIMYNLIINFKTEINKNII